MLDALEGGPEELAEQHALPGVVEPHPALAHGGLIEGVAQPLHAEAVLRHLGPPIALADRIEPGRQVARTAVGKAFDNQAAGNPQRRTALGVVAARALGNGPWRPDRQLAGLARTVFRVAFGMRADRADEPDNRIHAVAANVRRKHRRKSLVDPRSKLLQQHDTELLHGVKLIGRDDPDSGVSQSLISADLEPHDHDAVVVEADPRRGRHNVDLVRLQVGTDIVRHLHEALDRRREESRPAARDRA